MWLHVGHMASPGFPLSRFLLKKKNTDNIADNQLVCQTQFFPSRASEVERPPAILQSQNCTVLMEILVAHLRAEPLAGALLTPRDPTSAVAWLASVTGPCVLVVGVGTMLDIIALDAGDLGHVVRVGVPTLPLPAELAAVLEDDFPPAGLIVLAGASQAMRAVRGPFVREQAQLFVQEWLHVDRKPVSFLKPSSSESQKSATQAASHLLYQYGTPCFLDLELWTWC